MIDLDVSVVLDLMLEDRVLYLTFISDDLETVLLSRNSPVVIFGDIVCRCLVFESDQSILSG